jgi:hypothetical protein
VLSLSSSDTDEALELLSLSPAHGPHSRLSELHSSSGRTCLMIGPRLTIWLRVFMLRLPQMVQVPVHQQSVPRIAFESLSLMAHLIVSPIHKLLHLENKG